MTKLFQLIIAGLVANFGVAVDPTFIPDKFVCYWNSSSFLRSGPAKVNMLDLKPALSLCTHLIYNSAGINHKKYEIVAINPEIELDKAQGLYREVTDLKKCFPSVKVYLSVGGGIDFDPNYQKYLTLVETSTNRNKFIDSIMKLLTVYDFDGIDLAWQFPPVESKRKKTSLKSSIMNYAKSWIGRADFKDNKVMEHRKGFLNLVWDLNAQLKLKNKALTLTVLPNVNTTAYYDPELLSPNLDAIHLMTFDKVTADIDPENADYPAPLYGRNKNQQCIDSDVSYWINLKTPKEKIVIGIPTIARTWRLGKSDEKVSAGNPPVPAAGPGFEGSISSIPGFLSYPEICSRLNDNSIEFNKDEDVLNNNKSHGNFAFREYNPETGIDGIWIGYENQISVENKAIYAKNNGLGGVAIWDLSNDDVHGTCDGNRFPLASAAKFKLT